MKKVKETPWPQANAEAAQPFRDAVEALHGKAKDPATAEHKWLSGKGIEWWDEPIIYKPFPKDFIDKFDWIAFGTSPVAFALPGCGETTLHTAKPLPDAAYAGLGAAGLEFDWQVSGLARMRSMELLADQITPDAL